MQPILLDAQKQTPFDLLKAPIEELEIDCVKLTEPHTSLINLLLCSVENRNCWVGEGRIYPDVINGEDMEQVDEAILNSLTPLKPALLTTMVNQTLFGETKGVLLRLLLGTGRVEDAISFCLRDRTQRFRLPSIYMAVRYCFCFY